MKILEPGRSAGPLRDEPQVPAHPLRHTRLGPGRGDGTAIRPTRGRRRRIAGVLAALLVAAGLAVATRSLWEAPAFSPVCVYPRESIAVLGQIDALTGHSYSCVMTFDNANPTWATWEVPWFATTKATDQNWAQWVDERAGRRLVITTSLVPSDAPPNWRQICASGAYDGYAATFGRNLVSEGLSRSVLRIAPEANDPASGLGWSGGFQPDMSAWATCWAKEAKAMEVPGSHFVFDWTVNAGYEDIPFSDYYPGNSVVDVIGIDAYDSLVNGQQVAPGRTRWHLLSHEPGGILDLVAFAKSHRKPLSFPEWGAASAPSGGGDDPVYIRHMAQLFKKYHVVFESYFDENVGGTLRLGQVPKSLHAYQATVLHG